MSEADREKFHEYARRIGNEFDKFRCHSKWRMDKSAEPFRKWWDLQTQADKRFVLKIISMVEEFEA
jgi:hypothetical protein